MSPHLSGQGEATRLNSRSTIRPSTSIVFYLLFFFSGAAGLGYQLIWAKLFALGLGHELPAVLAVICAFMAGMAVGSWFLDRPLVKFPNRSYGLLELVIGLWGAVTALLIGPANKLALHLIGLDSPLRHWLVAFTIPLLVLLPSTVALGATFPAMERCIATIQNSGRTIPGIYAFNTFGAVAGILLSIFVVAPTHGFHSTLWTLAAVNILCGIGAFVLPIRGAAPPPESRPPQGQPLAPTRLRLTLVVTGLLGIGFETVGVRVLSQVLENTIYTYAAVLSIFLLGMAAGAAIYFRFARSTSRQLLATLLSALGLASLLSILLLKNSPAIYDYIRSLLGAKLPSVIAAEMIVAAAAFGLPTLLMGATFSHLAQTWRNCHGRVGRAAALNTAGAALAPLVASVLLLPTLGSKWTLTFIAIGYFCLMPALRSFQWAILGLSFILLICLPQDLHIIELPPNGTVLEYREGVMASVSVIEDLTHNRTLRVNNHFQMGGTGAAEAEYRHAHIPLLLQPAPKRALVLGLGTGITLGGATLHPGVKTEGVELLPEVLALMPAFEPFNHSPQRNPSTQLHIADARRFVKLTEGRYDVIIADLFHPAQDGAGALYTAEHFRAIRERLTPDGLFCQWLPLHQLDEAMLRVMVRTFLEVYPEAQAYLLRFNVDAPVLGLIGFATQRSYASNWIEQRLTDGSLQAEIKKLALGDSIRFFGNLLAGPKELTQFAHGAALNVDDHPIVMFRAPEFTNRKSGTSYGRLLTLLEQLKPDPAEVLHLAAAPEEQQFAHHLQDYFAARKAYIHGLVAEAEQRSSDAIDLFVESARLSSDFTPGYAQCLTLASLEARSNPPKARALLERLVAAQPSRPVAKQMLDRLFP